MSKWNTIPFKNLYSEPSKNGLMRPKAVRGKGYKMINMGEIFAFNRIKNPPMDLVPMNTIEKSKYTVHVGDLLFARQSLVAEGAGKCSIVLEVPETTTFESHLIRVRLDKTKAVPLYFYYYFTSYMGKGNVQSLVMQVAAAGIRASELAELQVPCPSLPIQHKIASILSAYDDLIENNTRRIAILEEMAQAIYQEWFVRFRYPGHEENKMVESELGMIPEGWEVLTFRDVSRSINRGISPKYDETTDSFVINQRCIRDGKLNLEVARTHCTPVPSTKQIKFGDVLINSTGVGTLGRVTQVYQDIPNYTADSHVTIIRPGDNVTIDYFGQYALSYQSHFTSSGVGSTGQTELSRESIANTIFLMPPIELQQNFTNIVSPLRKNIINLLKRTHILIRTRDLLLPKLISGEIDVEALDIVIPDMPEPEKEERQIIPVMTHPEGFEATQLALPL